MHVHSSFFNFEKTSSWTPEYAVIVVQERFENCFSKVCTSNDVGHHGWQDPQRPQDQTDRKNDEKKTKKITVSRFPINKFEMWSLPADGLFSFDD